jgi:hypothetical protein
MPYEKNTQVAGTLIPYESHTLLSNQLVNEVNEKKRKATIFLENSLFIYCKRRAASSCK